MTRRLTDEELQTALDRVRVNSAAFATTCDVIERAISELRARRQAELSGVSLLAELNARAFRICEKTDGGTYLNGYEEWSPIDDARAAEVLDACGVGSESSRLTGRSGT